VIRYIARRAGISVVMLTLASMLIFAALRIIPGDPTAARASRPGVTQEQLEQIRHELGLDRPIPEQYVRWLGGVLRGDFGTTYFSDYSTTELISRRIFPTVELAAVSIVLALLIAVPLGILAAMRPHSLLDRLIAGYASAGMALPQFWLAILLISLFSVQLGWLPTRGYVSVFDDPLENLRLIVLPSLTMAIVISAPILRFLRASLLETISADFIRTAQGKGLLWRRVVLRHALPNGLIPSLTFAGLVVGTMLGGIVVIEWVFGWQGLGSLALESVFKRDYAVLQGVVLLAAAAFIVTTLVVDLITLFLDPRLRAEQER
jgi:peptide/nickel transport system permease protein